MTHDQCEELIEALHRIGNQLFDVNGALYDIKDAIDKIPYYDDGDLVEAVKELTAEVDGVSTTITLSEQGHGLT